MRELPVGYPCGGNRPCGSEGGELRAFPALISFQFMCITMSSHRGNANLHYLRDSNRNEDGSIVADTYSSPKLQVK